MMTSIQEHPVLPPLSATELRFLFDQAFEQFREDLLEIPDTRTPLEVRDNGSSYTMFAKIPGLRREEIDLEVAPHSIVLHVRQLPHGIARPQRWLYHERTPLCFSNYIELPESIETETVEAVLRDGILALTLPKQKPLPPATFQHVELYKI